MFSDRTIASLLALGRIQIDPQPEKGSIQYQPASVEFRIGHDFIERSGDGDIPHNISPLGCLDIFPGECYLASTIETLTLPDNMVARVEGKSTWGRQFLSIHDTAGFIDPGFSGQITLEIKNNGNQIVTIYPKDRICQISFDWLDQPAARPYGHPELSSHYNGQMGPTLPHKESLR